MTTAIRKIDTLRDALGEVAAAATVDIQDSIASGDEAGFELATGIARDIMGISRSVASLASRHVAEATVPVGPPTAPPSAPPQGLVSAPSHPAPAAPIAPVTAPNGDVGTDGREKLPSSAYRKPSLVAIALLGGRAKFRHAQDVMIALMSSFGELGEIDLRSTEGTTSNRAVANSRSHHSTMVRQGVVALDGENDVLTDKGQAEVDEWLVAHDTSLGALKSVVPPALAEAYKDGPPQPKTKPKKKPVARKPVGAGKR